MAGGFAAACWRRLDDWLSEADVDPRWRLPKFQGRAVFGSAVGTSMFLAQFLFVLALNSEQVGLLVLDAVSAVILAFVGVSTARCTVAEHRRFEAGEFLCIFVVSIGGLIKANISDTDGQLFDMHTTAKWTGYMVPVVMCIRVRKFIVFVIVHAPIYLTSSVLNARTMTGLSDLISNDVVCFGLFVFVAVLQGRMLKVWQLSEFDLAKEQQATQSLVSMLCDGYFSLGADKDTIINSNDKFDFLCGRPMSGESLEGAIVGTSNTSHTSGRGQIEYLRSILTSSSDAGDDGQWNPNQITSGALPVTFNGASGSRVPVTLFIVGRAATSRKDKGPAVNFLVGVTQTLEQERTDFAHSMGAPLEPGPRKKPIDPDSARSVYDQSEQGTEGTGCTGRIFDVGHKDEATAQERMEQIEELGLREHWLLTDKQVQIHGNVLARGGQGAVLSGSFCGAPVVVKVIVQRTERTPLKAAQAMATELRILRHCRHPNLVQLQGALLVKQLLRIGIVLERADGGDLQGWIKQTPAPNNARVFRVMTHVARALWYLHTLAKPIVHGDLKSGNVLIFSPGDHESAKLADFGLAALSEAVAKSRARGTLSWMAPEVFRGDVPSHPAADVFSAGRLLQLLLCGTLPTYGMRVKALAMQLQEGIVAQCEVPDRGPVAAEVFAVAGECVASVWQQRPSARGLCEMLSTIWARYPDEVYKESTASPGKSQETRVIESL